jgi:hypothetical protein
MGNSYVLGNIFLNNYYAIYDLDKTRVGLIVAATSEAGKIENAIDFGFSTNLTLNQTMSNKYIQLIVAFLLGVCTI